MQKWGIDNELNELIDEENAQIKSENTLIKNALNKQIDYQLEEESDNHSRGFTSMFRDDSVEKINKVQITRSNPGEIEEEDSKEDTMKAPLKA